MNILFCGNDKVFDGVLTASLSLLKRDTRNSEFHFYILTMDFSELQPEYISITDRKIDFLREVVKTYNSNNEVTKIDITDMFKTHLKGSKNEQTSYSPYCMLRLFIDLIPELSGKVLYLDVDVLANKDITLLYDKDISNYEYAVAKDYYGKFLIHPNYIMNSGVMLLNLDKIRETGLLQKARVLAMNNKFLFPDQTAISKSTTSRLILSQRFNDQKFLHKSTVVRHFSKRLFWTPYPHTANIKQWQVSQIHRIFGYFQFDDILYEYIYLIKKFNKEHSGEKNG